MAGFCSGKGFKSIGSTINQQLRGRKFFVNFSFKNLLVTYDLKSNVLQNMLVKPQNNTIIIEEMFKTIYLGNNLKKYVLFHRIIKKVKEKFDPEAVVCQCGADGLAGDPMESFNLTHTSLAKCVYFMMEWKLPMLLLGGGRVKFIK